MLSESEIKSLQESEEQYRLLVENSLLGIGISCGNKVIFANPALLRIFGYNDLEEFSKLPLLNHVAPSSRELVVSRREKVASGEAVPSEFEYDILRKDGQIRTLLASSSHFKMRGETYTQTTFQDITERKRAENLLIIQKDLVSNMSEATDLNKALGTCLDAALKIIEVECGGIYLVDEKTGGLDLAVHKGLSEAFIKEVGHFDKDEPNTRLVMEGEAVYTNYQTLPFVVSDVQKKEGLKAIAIVPIKHADKVIGDINLATHKMDDIQAISRIAIESIAVDIGGIISRLRAEKDLQLKAQLLDNSTGSIFLHDTEGNFIYVNERAHKDLGYTRDELLNINLHSLDVPEYSKLIESRMANLKMTGEADFESAHFRKDGSIMPVEVHVRMIKMDGRDLILNATRDITERKKAEEELKKELTELQRFYKVTMGREDRILELKKEIKELKAGQGKQ
jgi:PAS domain S-box-containing protein